MRKPIIGISADARFEPDTPRSRGTISLNWNYAEVVVAAGGVPVILPPAADMAALAALLDGWMIPGGMDIDPAEYGQEPRPECALADPARFAAESFLYRALPPTIPVLGICYGMQLLNVLRGGTLIQHIAEDAEFGPHTGGVLQAVRLEGESRLATEVRAPEIEGESWHHQAINRLGQGLKVTALAPDGIVEAIEDPAHPFFVGVQWHPERTPDSDATKRLMAAFVRAAGG